MNCQSCEAVGITEEAVGQLNGEDLCADCLDDIEYREDELLKLYDAAYDRGKRKWICQCGATEFSPEHTADCPVGDTADESSEQR